MPFSKRHQPYDVTSNHEPHSPKSEAAVSSKARKKRKGIGWSVFSCWSDTPNHMDLLSLSRSIGLNARAYLELC